MSKKLQAGSEEMKKMHERVRAKTESWLTRNGEGISQLMPQNRFENLSRSQLLELIASMAWTIDELEKALAHATVPKEEDLAEKGVSAPTCEGEMMGRIGFNYAYIAQYPERAECWMKEVMRRGVDSIPRKFRPVMARAMVGERTGWLPAIAQVAGQPDCDSIILWALSIPGGDVPDLSDDAAGIVTYMDNEDENSINTAVLLSLPEDSRWIALCKDFAGQLLSDCH